MTPKSALFIASTSDIARHTARRFAKQGFDIILAARDEEKLELDKKDIEQRYGVEVKTLVFDAMDPRQTKGLIEKISYLPEVVFCALGYLVDQKVAEQNFEEAEKMMRLNYNAAIEAMEPFATKMEDRGSGSLIGVSSVAGDRGRAFNYYYGSAKAGFSAYLSGLRNRMTKNGVHVLTVKPGFVRTKMTADMDLPPLITAKPEQVAEDIFSAFQRKKNTLYTKWMWRYIMLIIKNIPESIFKKLSI